MEIKSKLALFAPIRNSRATRTRSSIKQNRWIRHQIHRKRIVQLQRSLFSPRLGMETLADYGKRSVAAMLPCCGSNLLCTCTRASHNFCRPCQEGPACCQQVQSLPRAWRTHTHAPPNNTQSNFQKGMQIHRAEMI